MPALLPADDELTPAIGYIRVSLAREEMISPELQRKAISDWAKRTGHRIVDWVEDLDKSGRNFKRKIMSVIERVEAGEASVIAVWKYSRFGRSRTGVPANLARVEKVGGELLSATEEIDARTSIGRFQRGMIMEMNAFESDRAGEQWSETHRWRRDQGLPATGRKRFGYIWHPRKVYAPDGTITLQQERYEPDVALMDTVTDLYKRYCAGTGFATLAANLNEAGHRTVSGGLWSDRTICLYMDSGFAAGYLRSHDPDCKVIPYRSSCPAHRLHKHPTNAHPSIISDDLWQQYRDRRAFTKNAGPHARKARYPLTSLARCGLCGGAALRSSNGKGYASFVCTARVRKGPLACSGVTVGVSIVEAAVREWLEGLAAEVDAEARTLPVPRPAHAVLAPTVEQQRAKAEVEIERLERAVSKHMRVYAMSETEDQDGSLEREYLATLGDLRRDKAAATARLAALGEAPTELQSAKMRATVVPLIPSLLDDWDSMRPERINVLLRRIIARVEIRPGHAVEVAPVWAGMP
ncbi:recombinase family protein [Kitasatospora sp. NBC_00240]|uniref:recombinase family protein n=1 Tax=Kitasatospora sp. NBC_00240 TaxID=2903567 RepID=UPI0022502DEB|nr:recombinase family protein [Kitasatospora sp. NBC_00240]MCX5209701.1 recombinase family protein [Kitasatospora sp. NBC_00240]